MLVVFWPFGDAPGLILDCPKLILKPRNRIFRGFVARAGLQYEHSAHLPKPQFFLGFSMVFTHRKHCAPAIERGKIVPGAC